MYAVYDVLGLFHEPLVGLIIVALRHILLLLPFLPILILISLTILHYQFTNSFKLTPIIFYKSTAMNPKNKSEADQQLLEEFLNLKPVRAIDRMLNENSIDRVFALYNCLQQKIRRNTSDLRSTLTDKYENLIDCSNLLTTIQKFTHQIEDIEKDISRAFHQDVLQDQSTNKKGSKGLINLIEERLYRKKYQSAMNLSLSPQRQALEQSERLYLPCLRIQILQSLQQQLLTKKISQKLITETIACISTYIQGLSSQQRQELTCNSGNAEEGTLINLISETLKSQSAAEQVSQGDILEIVFKCKLFSLNYEQKRVKEVDRIAKFFHDIYQLMCEKERGDNQINRLAEIFCRNLSQIESNLSETFIVTSADQIISFRYDIYEQLLSSNEFMRILEQLHLIIAQHYKDAPSLSLKDSFINLWNNYYKQLLTLLFDRCDPTVLLGSCLRSEEANIPGQILKYLVGGGPSVQSSLQRYQQELEVFSANLKQLLTRTENFSKTTINSREILSAIQDYYLQKIKQINARIAQTSTKLSKQPSENSLRSIILLFFFCDQFNIHIQQQTASGQHLQELTRHSLKWDQQNITQFSQVFSSNKQRDWNIRFDTFFMSYNPSALSPSKVNILKQVITTILEGMLRNCDRGRAQALISDCRTKKEREQRQASDRRNRLADLPREGGALSNFSKKKRMGEA